MTLNSDALSRVELGTFKVKKPGYVRMDVRGVKINEGADFGSIESVLVGGNVGSVVRVTPDFSSHFGRRGPSVHLNYSLPNEQIEWFYNEIVVPEEGVLYGLRLRRGLLRHTEQQPASPESALLRVESLCDRQSIRNPRLHARDPRQERCECENERLRE